MGTQAGSETRPVRWSVSRFWQGLRAGVSLNSAYRAGSSALRDYRLLALLVGGAAAVALAAVPDAPRGLWLLGAFIGLLYYVLFSQRERQRQRLLAEPLPESYRDVLLQRVPLYRQLDSGERQRFEDEVKTFLAEQRIYALQVQAAPNPMPWMMSQSMPNAGAPGPAGLSGAPFQISDEQRVLIAASAATLLLGRPEWRLPTVRDIVVYPTAFAEETYNLAGGHGQPGDPYAHTLGMVHSQGPILFALDAIERSYPRSLPHGMQAGEPVLPHVGIHEFAHVLDFMGAEGRAGGMPGFLAPADAERWNDRLRLERDRLERGDSALNPYGLKNDAELFAVSVESFFQDPIHLRARHPELYSLLGELFNQDPAARLLAWETALSYRPLFSLSPPVRYTA